MLVHVEEVPYHSPLRSESKGRGPLNDPGMNLSSFKNFRAVGGKKKTASPAANIFCNLLCFLSSVLASESCQMSGPKKFEPREEFAEGNFPLGG